jgi:hypothetical protein
VVERQLPKLNVVGSIPIARSNLMSFLSSVASCREKMRLGAAARLLWREPGFDFPKRNCGPRASDGAVFKHRQSMIASFLSISLSKD